MIGRGWMGRLLGLGHRTRHESEAELRFHVEERIDRLVANGWSRADAAVEVSRRFGDFEDALAECERVERTRVRQGRVRAMGNEMARATRLTWRTVRRNPGFASTLIVTLALGIAATTTMFSVLHGSLLTPLPYPDEEALVRVHNQFVETGGSGPFSVPNFVDVRAQNRALEGLAGYSVRSVTLAGEGSSDRVRALAVTSDFLSVLAVAPAIGRDLEAGSERVEVRRTALISHATWRGRYAADPGVLGTELRINDVAHEIVGVLPADFWFTGDPQVVYPFSWTPEGTADGLRGNRSLPAIGRLAPGVTPDQAAADLTRITDGIAESFPSNMEGWVVTATPWREFVLGGSASAVWLLTGAVSLILLIACVNAANLTLVQSEQRARESAVRAAIGASRATLVTRHLTESVTLALVAGAFGVVLSFGMIDVLLALWGDDLPRASTIQLDAAVLAAAIAVTVLSGLLVGLVPALRIDMRRLQNLLRSGTHGSTGGSSRIQRMLVVGEVAGAVILVTGAGLLIQSFRNLSSVETGIDPDRAMVFSTQLPASYTAPEERKQLFEAAVDQLGRLEGVEAVGISERTPLQGGYNITTLASPVDPEIEASFVEVRRVTPDFFRAAGIELVAGRLFEPPEFGGGAGVVVVSRTLADQIFPTGEWRGQRILPSQGEAGYEIVGIVESVREFGVEREARPAVYWPFGETPSPASMTFVVRTTGRNPLEVMPQVRRVMGELEPGAPLYAVRALRDVMTETMGDRVFATSLFVAFGVLALGLAGLGIFGVLAYVVEQRRREIGIRLALGATSTGIRKLVARETLMLAGVGLLAGGIVAALASSVLEDLLFEVVATDPLLLASVMLVATTGALAASWLPARRATRVDPMIAMREE